MKSAITPMHPFRLVRLSAVAIALTFLFAVTSLAQSTSSWQLQVHGGLSKISGDVAGLPGIGGGFAVSRKLGKAIDLRADYTGSFNYGLDVNMRNAAALNAGFGINPWKTYYAAANAPFVANYRTGIHQFSLQGVIGIHSWNITRANNLQLYGMAGYSFLLTDVDVNALSNNLGLYNFPSLNYSLAKNEVRTRLKDLLDDNYESNYRPGSSQAGNKNYFSSHGVNAGAGFQYALSQRIGLALEYRITKPFTDDIDALNDGKKNDLVHYTSLRLNYSFGNVRRNVSKKVSAAGVQVYTTDQEKLFTVQKFIEPFVSGEKLMSPKDTSYFLHFRYTPTVIGTIASEEILILRLANKQLVVLPFASKAARLPGLQDYAFKVKLSKDDLTTLVNNKVVGFKFEAGGYTYDDQLPEASQDILSSIASQLLRR